MISVTGSIPASELIVVGGDLNGHVGTNVDGYDGVHGGYGFGERNSDGERILEFCDAMELIVTNTGFKRQKNELATYVSGGTVSAIDYLLLRRCDRRYIKNVKVIAGEECVSQHRLLVGDVVISSAPRNKKRMHIPMLKVWKLREPNVKQEFPRLVTERKDEVFEADNVESKWNATREVWQKATEQVCGWTKGPPRHSETWWWNDEVAKAIDEKRRCYKIWHKTKTASDRYNYKEAR